ncbi:ABC transporter substrate-binding protein [Flexivirga oryzae]|uniref:Iron complex transport system substrate-binding protein n=1 Tax=Flexivirga oryzae TaxID=1794944 RepID=A0A839NCP9_9MICO|nr:ABC transporter substrate-binding protein [Flexivirga oryzae]MBB2892481.1 iron complex transport system substrate-binding protein [Flexivirga oryzae]
MDSITNAPLSRRAALGAGLAGAAALLAACGSSSSAGSGASGPATAAGSAGDTAWKPVSVKHAFGTTTVEKQPTRIVTVGVTEQDFVLALGVKPVGVTDWYGDQPYAMWPWARAANGDNKPKLLKTDDGFQFTEIAKLQPDLIIGTNSGMTSEDYGKLSKLAPTVPQASTKKGYFAPWYDMLATIGTSMGKSQEATALRSSIKAKFSTAAADHPKFKGTKAIFLQNAVSDGSLIAYPEGLGTEFLADLGFEVPSDIDKYVREGEQAYIPVEQIHVLNSAEVLIWATEKPSDLAALQKVPGFSNLDAVKSGRSVYTGGELSGAIYFSSPLSLPYVVDKLTPKLTKALA